MNNSLIKEKYKLYFKSSYYKTDNNNKLNLYIHVPFCAKICFYCNCFKKLRQREIEIDLYVKFLKKEVKELYKLNNNKKIKINTIFIGWWTPNLLNINQFNNIFLLIKKYFDLSNLEQFLIDWHPNYYTEEKIRLFKKNNVSRVTLAVQTFDEKVLKLNNRDVYNKEEFEKNINFLNENNIASNIDLLIWLKWQTLNSIKNDIKFLQGISISNISIHYLMKSNNIKYDLPDNYLDLIKKTREYLENINLPKLSPNIQEDYFVSKKSSTISLWSNWVINLFWKIIYIKPWIKKYFDDINQNNLFINE